MILSRREIEEIAAAATKDFNDFYFGKGVETPVRFAQPTPIDQFAKDYLKLSVSYIRLSPDGSLCGLTAYADTSFQIEEMGVTRTIDLRRNQVLLDNSFIQPGNMQKLCGKRRFTLAHECAHQILFQLESDKRRAACEQQYAPRRCYSLRDLKTREDWNEWQANVLGAAILMPQKEIDRAMKKLTGGNRLKSYEGRFPHNDGVALAIFCQTMGVSKTAAVIRLRELGYIEDLPRSEYVDPLEVWA